MPVGGPRHYQGAGLGQIGIWACPSCGEDNTGKLEQGCVHCGAGVPREPVPPPTPPPPDTPVQQRGEVDTDVLRRWRAWEQQYPDATGEMCYVAGYAAGFHAARVQMTQAQARQQPEVPVIGDKTYRTLIVALSLFRDQVLLGRPEEVESGEWLSAEEATTVIRQLQEALGEVAHV